MINLQAEFFTVNKHTLKKLSADERKVWNALFSNSYGTTHCRIVKNPDDYDPEVRLKGRSRPVAIHINVTGSCTSVADVIAFNDQYLEAELECDTEYEYYDTYSAKMSLSGWRRTTEDEADLIARAYEIMYDATLAEQAKIRQKAEKDKKKASAASIKRAKTILEKEGYKVVKD